jgi:FtsZ-binding cell division protein ZapB
MLKTTTVLLALLIPPVFAIGAEAADPQVAQLRIEVEELRSEVKRLAQQVSQLKEALDAVGSRPQQPASQPSPKPEGKQQARVHWQKSFEIADGKGGRLDELGKPSVGLVGRLPGGWFTVVQILSETEAIAAYRIQKAHTPEKWERAIFAGIDTADMVDEKSFSLGGYFIVTGTRRIRTVGGGSFTYFVIEPLDEKAWRAAYLEYKKQGFADTR